MKDKSVTMLATLPKLATPAGTAKAIQKVAAYARVSTDHEDQETSLSTQTSYYKKKILEHPGWEFVAIYVDDGISGLSTNRREGFNQMIEDCLAGKIDLVLTKSISRFARNTVDTVTTIRKLKEKGIGVYFEKENIFSIDSKGEFLLTLMSSLAQEESRSISENVTWGRRKLMADGKVSVAYSNFLGYDKGPEKYTMVVNKEQAKYVKQIFRLFLQGYSSHTIAMILTKEKIPTMENADAWCAQTVRSVLGNEKYKGDALLQKFFTVDFLSKKTKVNQGELPQYYVEGDHEAIISPWLFDYVQEEIKRRLSLENRRYSGITLFTNKLICGECGSYFNPRPWHSTSIHKHTVWQCANRIVKGTKCSARNVYDEQLHFVVHDVAMKLICKRHIDKNVMAAVLPLVDESRQRSIATWLRKFRKRNIWELQSDEDDIAMIIRDIVIAKNGESSANLIDGSVLKYQLQPFHPSSHEKEKEQAQHPKKRKATKKTNAVSDFPVTITQCQNCGKEILQMPKQKTKLFCSDDCRHSWWSRNRDKIQSSNYHEQVCFHCGKVFLVYGKEQRKYCCYACYVEERFGKSNNGKP